MNVRFTHTLIQIMRNIYDYAKITIKNGRKRNLDNCRLFKSLRQVFFLYSLDDVKIRTFKLLNSI